MRVIFGLFEMDSFSFLPGRIHKKLALISLDLACNATTDVVHFLLQIGRMQAAKSRPFSMGRHAGAQKKQSTDPRKSHVVKHIRTKIEVRIQVEVTRRNKSAVANKASFTETDNKAKKPLCVLTHLQTQTKQGLSHPPVIHRAGCRVDDYTQEEKSAVAQTPLGGLGKDLQSK